MLADALREVNLERLRLRQDKDALVREVARLRAELGILADHRGQRA